MFCFGKKSRKIFALLLCFSISLVLVVSCAPPVITLAVLSGKARTVIALMNVTEKALYLTSDLVSASYTKLGEDIRSEDFANQKISSQAIKTMEVRHSELLGKQKELDTSLSKTDNAANEFFNMLRTRANQNSKPDVKEKLLQDINLQKTAFNEKLKVADNAASNLKKSIQGYDDILGELQVRTGLGQVEKYIKTIESITAQYETLNRQVQVSLQEGRTLIASSAGLSPNDIASSSTSPPSPSPTLPPSSSSASPPSSSPTPSLPLTNRPILGVKIITLTPEIREKINQNKDNKIQIAVDEGILISEVERGFPAAEAGLLPGDVIVKVNDNPITNGDKLPGELAKYPLGTKLPIEVIRQQQRLRASVELRARPSAIDSEPQKP